MQNLPVFQAAAATLAARCDQASRVLADLAEANAEFLIPRAEFCDDDWYVYEPDTLEVVQVIGASDHRAAFYRPPAGLAALRGLWAKGRGLWRYAA